MWQVREKHDCKTINSPESTDKYVVSSDIVVDEDWKTGHGSITPLLHQHKTSCWGRVNGQEAM
jgi:hypothetical protein